ncbi:MAG: hypothetical protein NC543_15225 [bacterium]|nr:hypothetical protein [bacterium]MCM1376645.1 hypothetical protein [Muribaculum sp.]
MRGKGATKKKIGAGIVQAGFVLLCIFVCWQASAMNNGAGNFLKKMDGRKAAQNDGPIQQADIAAQCEVWESRYEMEAALPVELFSDLQRYVAEGKCVAALADYRQEELICTAEDLAKACPDYETLLEKYFADERGENILQTDKIYRLEGADGKNCFLLFYLHYSETDSTGFLSTVTLLRDGEEWQLTGNTGGVSGVQDYEIFAREEAGEKVFYFLKRYDSLTWLSLSRLSESFHIPLGGWVIRPIETGVEPEAFYPAAEGALAERVKEYIEENACFLAWMWQNGKPIWGDEGKEVHYAMREAAALEVDEAEQNWTIDFGEANQKETVTFRMTETEDGSLLLEAYAGGEDESLLLSCKLIFVQEVGVDKITPAYWEAFDCNGLTARKTEKLAWNEMWERALQEQRQRSIATWQGEKNFPNEVYDLMREEAWTGLCGEPNMRLDRYKIDLTEDTKSFVQMVSEMGKENVLGDYREEWECKWAYRWLGVDGSENFLSCINYCYAKDSIQWWKVTEGRLEEYAHVTESYEPSWMISCEGQAYWITEAVPDYRGGDVNASVMEIGDGDNWRTACFFISADFEPVEEQDYTCIPLYEKDELSVGIKDYVQGRCEEIVSACRSVKLLSDMEERQGLTAAAYRMLNSLSDGSVDMYTNYHYFVADIDNDGTVEYGVAEDGRGLEVIFYEMEKGEFHIIPFEEMLLEQDGATNLPVEVSFLRQLWCEKLGDTTYLFTVEEVAYSPDLLLRIRVLREDRVEEKAVYLLQVNMAEDYREGDIEITPSAEGVG